MFLTIGIPIRSCFQFEMLSISQFQATLDRQGIICSIRWTQNEIDIRSIGHAPLWSPFVVKGALIDRLEESIFHWRRSTRNKNVEFGTGASFRSMERSVEKEKQVHWQTWCVLFNSLCTIRRKITRAFSINILRYSWARWGELETNKRLKTALSLLCLHATLRSAECSIQ